jgi:hypothetical protein
MYMKILMKPIKMISINQEDGIITPIRFQMKDNADAYTTVKIDNIVLLKCKDLVFYTV